MQKQVRSVERLQTQFLLNGRLQSSRIDAHKLEVTVPRHELLEGILGPVLGFNVTRHVRGEARVHEKIAFLLIFWPQNQPQFSFRGQLETHIRDAQATCLLQGGK